MEIKVLCNRNLFRTNNLKRSAGLRFVTKTALIMKLTFLLIIVAVVQTSAGITAQTVTYSAKSVSLQKVFNAIKNQTGYLFFYRMEDLNNTQPVTVDLKEVPIEKALQQVLIDQPLTWSIENRTVIIVIKPNPAEAYNPPAKDGLPPPQTITGTIVDDNNTAISGASVVLQPVNRGTSTNEKGVFTFTNVPVGNYSLEVSFVGFKKIVRKVAVSDKPVTLAFNMIRDLNEEEELIVSTGYQTIPKERSTGSFATIGRKELDRTISYSIVDKLEGTVSGLLYDPLGITLRGVSTLNASRLPLVVLDGFPITIDRDENDYLDENEFSAFQRTMESISPGDVESITVLKDAAAASIWGVRAANGVIVITTRRSRSREPEINFSASVSSMPKPNVNKLPYANPQTQLAIEKGRYDAGWFDAFILNMDEYYYNLSDYAYTAARVEEGKLPAQTLADLERQMGSYDNRQDFSKLFMRPNIHQQYNLSVSQNAGFNNYRFSVAYDRDLAVMKQDEESRVVLNFTNQFKPVDWLLMSFGSNLSLRREKQNGVEMGDLYDILPHQSFVDENNDYTSQTTFLTSLNYGRPFREAFYEDSAWLPYDWEYNLKREFDNKDNSINTTDLRLQGGVTIKPWKTDMVVVDMKYQYEKGSIRQDNMYNEETWETRFKVNQFASPTGNHPVPKGNIFDQQYNTSYSHDFLLTGKFYKEFGGRHLVALLAGAQVREEYRDRSNSRRYAYNPQTLTWATQMDYHSTYPRNMYPNNAYYIESAFSTIYNYWLREDRYVSTFWNAAYTLDSKYDITGSWRLDQSNMFGKSPKYRQVPLWSVGLGWSIDKESFFDIDFINRLRLRATYGASGNVDKSTSPYAIATVGGSQTNSELQLPGAQYTNPANPELRWEKTKQLNIGLEFSMMSNRINGEIEYYNRNGIDLLATKAINATYGFSTALINFGNMRNSGIDINLSAILLKKPLTWRTQVLLSYNKNVVTKTDMEDLSKIALTYLLSPNSSNRIQAGKPRYYLLSIPWGGLDPDGIPQFYHADKLENALTSTLATNSFGFENLIYEGPTQAPYYGSWNNVFSFKQFELSFLAIFKFGHKYLHTSPFRVSNNDLYGFAQGNLVPHYAKEFENMWKKPGDELKTDIPRLPFEYTGTSARAKTAWYNNAVNFGSHQVLNATTIRLQRITLSYALKRNILPPKLKDLRFLLQARNIHTFTFNKYHEDPEHLPDMMGYFLLSTSPEYTFSIQASF